MAFLFSKPKTTKEVVRDNKRQIQHSQRDLEREMLTLEREEKKLVLEIKRLAKAGQNSSAKTMAKELIRIRKQKEKLLSAKTQLSGVSSRVTTMSANQTVAKSMVGATQAMGVANAAAPIQQMQRTMMNYEKQSEMMNMKEEMMDDMFEGDEQEEVETEETMNQVLDSIGLDISSQLSKATPGKSSLATQQAEKSHEKEVDNMLSQI